MSDMSPVKGFDEALENLDFDRARMLADQAEGPEKKRLGELIRVSRAEAADRAEQLAARIQFLARADHYEGLLALAADPTTEPLLALVSVELRRGAMLHLDGAVRRQRRFRAAAQRHMKAAAEALVLFDTAKALSEIGKVEPRWLTVSQREELEKLRTQTDTAAAERSELEALTAEVLRDHQPEIPPSNRERHDKTRFSSRRGCATVLMLLTGTTTAAAVVLASIMV